MVENVAPSGRAHHISYGSGVLFLFFVGLLVAWAAGAIHPSPVWAALYAFNVGVHGERFFRSLP